MIVPDGTKMPFASQSEGVEIRLVGDVTCGRRVLCSHLALDSVAFLYCVKGKIRVSLSDAETRTLSDGDILIVFPGRFLSLDAEGRANRLMYLGFRGPQAVSFALKMGFWDLMRGNDPYQGDFFSSIVERFNTTPAHGRDPILLGRVEQLLDMVWSRLRNGTGPSEFYDAVRALNRLPLDRYTTDEAASALGLSRTKLNTIMVANGLGRPGKYLARNRFALARAMLFFTRDSTERIAERLGFSSASAFGVFFRQYAGRTPGDFRKSPIPA